MSRWKPLAQKGFGRLLPMLWWLASLCVATAGPYHDFAYESNSPDTNTVTIIGYIGSGGVVEIPSNMEGKAVSIIGDVAFPGQDSLVNLTILDSDTNRGAPAPP